MNVSLMDPDDLLRKLLSGVKVFPDEVNFLCAEAPLSSLATAARTVSQRLHPKGTVGYAVSRTVVYSNVCQPNCPFCRGTVLYGDPAAFTRTADEVVAEVATAVAQGATEIVLQGGHRVDLPWEYYPGLVRAIKDRFGHVEILGFSPSELMVFNFAYRKRSAAVLGELKEAGMGGLIAGGDETLWTRVPEYRFLLRGPWNEWFDIVHRCADTGLPVVVPFVIGVGETVRERVGHLLRVRAFHERTRAAGRSAVRTLSVFTLGQEAGHSAPSGATAAVTSHQYLRMVALARILLPTIPHIQSSFVSQGAAVAVAALEGGADDLGGTHLEFDRLELGLAGTGPMTATEIERLVRLAGRIPDRR